ncbi:MAG: hypothetical protein EP321_02460 [Sphingomonadales bacterium]|nr:MAG: hypothetical protein EP345_16425 [Sphingomonadales bacterium]TNF05770.1 MAG: hypothetical protein EP321_02460 [Sphingomonadales bacterium]
MKSFTFTFTADEVEILVDALDADMEGYEDSVKDARANGNRADVATFSEAAARIKAVRDRIKAEIGDED